LEKENKELMDMFMVEIERNQNQDWIWTNN